MRKLSESIWGDLRKKSLGQEVRSEDGKKVPTCLGIDVVLKKPDSLYDRFIKEILARKYSDCSMGILSPRDLNLSPDEMKNVRNWEAPYTYLIYDGAHGTSLIANFYTYSDLLENDPSYEDYPEEDYIQLCRCIATKLKEIGDCISYVPRNKTFTPDGRNDETESYEGECQLKLIDEGDVYQWECDNREEYENPFGNTYLEDFQESLISEFPELEDEIILCWAYSNYGGCSIAIPISADNVMNVRKYKDFTKKWFEV